jgi:presequence protease
MKYEIGQKIHGFIVDRVVNIHEIKCILRELTHEATGAKVIHIENNDPENVFCLSFQTIPTSSNGVAHILEHAVLCGSEKYPVHDPFFSMNRRSLNTFMNAMTGADFTCYPAATQVPQDFYNLLEVYLDAVFHPLLTKESFLQEGWRLQFSDPKDEKTPLEYKGIVYNEMKGALSSPQERLVEKLNETLYPDLTYGFNSGGDPKDIPKLSYEEFLSFHKNSYHPSRAIFYFYGDLPLEGHLEFISKHVLEQTTPLPPRAPLPRQKRFPAPKFQKGSYPFGTEEDPRNKSIGALGWLTCHVLEQKELLALSVINLILMSSDAAPLKKALLRSGLCSQVGAYIDSEATEVPFVLIFQGIKDGKSEELLTTALQTLKNIVKDKIPENLIERSLHQLEFSRSEISGEGFPYGLSLYFRSVLTRQHGGKPEFGLMIHSLFKELRESIAANPRYLEDLIEKHLIDNPHRAFVTLEPSTSLAEKEVAAERRKLDQIKSELSKGQIDLIKSQAENLDKYQKAHDEDNLDILPKISIEDIPEKAKDFPLDKKNFGNLNVYHHDCFTNGIIYTDYVYNIPEITEDMLPYIRIFAMLISQVGCGGRNYEENLEYIQANTGGIGASLSLNTNCHDFNIFNPTLHIRGSALHAKIPKLLPLLKDIIVSLDFDDVERIKEILFKHYTSLETNYTRHAMKYAINLGASGLSGASKISNDWFGLNHYNLMKELVVHFDTHKNNLIEKLKFLRESMLGLDSPDLVITCEKKIFEDLAENRFYGLLDVPAKSYKPWNPTECPASQIPSQGRKIQSHVAFSSQVLPGLPYTHPQAAGLSLASQIFDNAVLHPKIREQGGAYGSGAVNNALGGIFYFYAYRDPNIYSTFNAFKEAVDLVAEGRFDESRLEEAKLEIIQSLDHPVSPGDRGEVAYSWMRDGRTLEIREAYRDQILKMTSKDVQNAVREHLVPRVEKGINIVFSGKELLEKENEKLKDRGLSLMV